VVAHKPGFGVSDHPVCGAKVGFFEIFLMPQPPLLTRRGIHWPKNLPNEDLRVSVSFVGHPS